MQHSWNKSARALIPSTNVGRWWAFVVVAFIVTLPWSTAQAQLVSVTGNLSPQFELAPGVVRQGSFVVKNPADVAQRVQIYLRDLLSDDPSRVSYPSAGSIDRSLAPWIELHDSDFTLEPGESREVSYTVRAPKDFANPVGTYWAVVMIESVTERADSSPLDSISDNSYSLRLGVRFRHAVLVRGTFSERGARLIAFEQPGVSLDPANPTERLFHVDVINRGDSDEQALASLDLYDERGLPVNQFEETINRLLPDESKRLQWKLGALEPGNYQAVLLIDAGQGDIFGARYRFGVTDE